MTGLLRPAHAVLIEARRLHAVRCSSAREFTKLAQALDRVVGVRPGPALTFAPWLSWQKLFCMAREGRGGRTRAVAKSRGVPHRPRKYLREDGGVGPRCGSPPRNANKRNTARHGFPREGMDRSFTGVHAGPPGWTAAGGSLQWRRRPVSRGICRCAGGMGTPASFLRCRTRVPCCLAQGVRHSDQRAPGEGSRNARPLRRSLSTGQGCSS